MLLVLRGMVLGCPGSSSKPERHEGCQHLGPARLVARTTASLGLSPGLRQRECLGTFPTCPETLCPLLQGSWPGGDPCRPGPAAAFGGLCVEQVPTGAMGRWACGLQSMLPPWLPSSTRIHVCFLRSFQDHRLLLTRSGSLAPCTGGSLNPLSTRHGVHGPLSPITCGVQAHLASQTRAEKALRGRRLPRIPRLMVSRVGL